MQICLLNLDNDAVTYVSSIFQNMLFKFLRNLLTEIKKLIIYEKKLIDILVYQLSKVFSHRWIFMSLILIHYLYGIFYTVNQL